MCRLATLLPCAPCHTGTCAADCSGAGACFDGVCRCAEGYCGSDCALKCCLNDCSGRGDCFQAAGVATCRKPPFHPPCRSHPSTHRVPPARRTPSLAGRDACSLRPPAAVALFGHTLRGCDGDSPHCELRCAVARWPCACAACRLPTRVRRCRLQPSRVPQRLLAAWQMPHALERATRRPSCMEAVVRLR